MLRYFALAGALLFLGSSLVRAQLNVGIHSPKIAANKAVVRLSVTNSFSESVTAARCTCFLLDPEGKIAGQSTKWVLGSAASIQELKPGAQRAFNFVLSGDKPFANTNLTAKISFSRVVLKGGKAADVRNAVRLYSLLP